MGSEGLNGQQKTKLGSNQHPDLFPDFPYFRDETQEPSINSFPELCCLFFCVNALQKTEKPSRNPEKKLKWGKYSIQDIYITHNVFQSQSEFSEHRKEEFIPQINS